MSGSSVGDSSGHINIGSAPSGSDTAGSGVLKLWSGSVTSGDSGEVVVTSGASEGGSAGVWPVRQQFGQAEGVGVSRRKQWEPTERRPERSGAGVEWLPLLPEASETPGAVAKLLSRTGQTPAEPSGERTNRPEPTFSLAFGLRRSESNCPEPFKDPRLSHTNTTCNCLYCILAGVLFTWLICDTIQIPNYSGIWIAYYRNLIEKKTQLTSFAGQTWFGTGQSRFGTGQTQFGSRPNSVRQLAKLLPNWPNSVGTGQTRPEPQPNGAGTGQTRENAAA